MIEFQRRLVMQSHILFRKLDNEAVLLNLQNESYYGLDPVGTEMWDILLNASSIQEAHQQLLDLYEVEPQKLMQDLTAFIESLMANGLVIYAEA
jgi:hypothetical protein